MIQLGVRDATAVYLQRPAVPTPIVLGYLFEMPAGAELTPSAVREWVAARVGLHPLYRRRIARVPLDLDHPYLVEDRVVDLDRHVFVRAACEAGWAGVRREVERLSVDDVALDIPPWELHVFTGIGRIARDETGGDTDGDDTETVAVVVRFHHAACDGIAAIEAIRVLFGSQVTDARPDLESRMSRGGLFTRALGTVPRRMMEFRPKLAEVRAATERAGKLAKESGRPSPSPRPRTPFDGKLGVGRVFDAVDFALAEVQAARSAVAGATVNDVMTSAIAGALANCLREQGQDLRGVYTTSMPISVRGRFEATGPNQIRILLVDLHLDIEDPVQRLAAIQRSIRIERDYRLSDAAEASGGRLDLLPGLVYRALGRLEDRRARTADGPVASTVTAVTNTHEGPADMQLGPARVVSTYGALALEQCAGISHSITTIGEVLTVSVVSTPQMLPDVERYTADVRAEFSRLLP